MLNRFVPGSRFLSPLTCFLLVASPVAPAAGVVEESRSTLHTYAPSVPGGPIPFHCNDCWDLRPETGQPLPQHQAPRYRRGHHDRGLRPHKHPFAKKSRVHNRGLRLLHRHALSLGGFERTLQPWQIRAVDGDTIRFGRDRIRIRGYNAPELSEPGGWDAAIRLERLLREGPITILPHGHDVYGRTLADVFVNGHNVAEPMIAEGYARRG